MSTEDDPYLATLSRIESDLAMIDTGTGWASVSISLRRIADALDQVVKLPVPAVEYKWLRHVRHDDLAEYLALGYRLVPETRPTHHHDYSCMVEWTGRVEPPIPPKKEGTKP